MSTQPENWTMTPDELREAGGVSVQEMQPDDVVIVRLKEKQPHEVMRHMRAVLESAFGNRKYLFLEPSVEIEVKRPTLACGNGDLTTFDGKSLGMVRGTVIHAQARGKIAIAYCLNHAGFDIGHTGEFVCKNEDERISERMRLASITRVAKLDDVVLWAHRFVSVGMRD